jgi:hypothetical protein
MSVSAWADFLDARHRLIKEWAANGIPGHSKTGTTAKMIADQLNRHDEVQIQLVAMTPVNPPSPCTTRKTLADLVSMLPTPEELRNPLHRLPWSTRNDLADFLEHLQ